MKLEQGNGIVIDVKANQLQPQRVFSGTDDLYWSHDYQEILLSSPSLQRFLPRVDVQPDGGEPEVARFSKMVENVEVCGTSRQIQPGRLKHREINDLRQGLIEFASLADTPKVQPSKRKFIENFSLPIPAQQPEAWRTTDRGELLILWGYHPAGSVGDQDLKPVFSRGANGKLDLSAEGKKIIDGLASRTSRPWTNYIIGLAALLPLLCFILYLLMPRPVVDFSGKVDDARVGQEISVTDMTDYDGINNFTTTNTSVWVQSNRQWESPGTNSPGVRTGFTERFKRSDGGRSIILTSRNALFGIPFLSKADSKSGTLPNTLSFTLKVEGGSGAGTYMAGAVVPVEAKGDYKFLRWEGDTAGLTQSAAMRTAFTMPNRDAVLRAVFEGGSSRPSVTISIRSQGDADKSGLMPIVLQVDTSAQVAFQSATWRIDGKIQAGRNQSLEISLRAGQYQASVEAKYKDNTGADLAGIDSEIITVKVSVTGSATIQKKP